jgi:beta-galactosidase
MDAQTFKEWQDPEINAVNRAPMLYQLVAYESTEAATEAVKEKIRQLYDFKRYLEIRWVKDSDARPD